MCNNWKITGFTFILVCLSNLSWATVPSSSALDMTAMSCCRFEKGTEGSLRIESDMYNAEISMGMIRFEMAGSPSISFFTKRIAVGKKEYYRFQGLQKKSSLWSVRNKKILFPLSPGLHEYYVPYSNAIEQGWIFDAPGPSGPISIEIGYKFYRTETKQKSGTPPHNDNNNIKDFYSEAHVFDSKGLHLEIKPVFKNNTIHINIPSKWLADAVFPIIVDPLIGSEASANKGPYHAMTSSWRYGSTDISKDFFIAGELEARDPRWNGIILGPTLSNIGSLAGGGVVYGDIEHHVSAPLGVMVISSLAGSVRVRVFNDSGSSVSSFTISADSGYFTCQPSVYSNSTHFLVVWDERRLAAGAVNRRCGGSGDDPVKQAIFAVFTDDYIQANIYGALINLSGNIVGSKFIIAVDPGVIQVAPGVSSGYTFTNTTYPYREDFFVVWSRFTDEGVMVPQPDDNNSPSDVQPEFPVLYGTRVSDAGVVLDGVNGIRLMAPDGPNEITFTRPQWDPRVSFSSHGDGDHYLVVWDEGGLAGFALGGESAIHASRVEITDTGFINHDAKGVPVGYFPGSGAFDPDVVWNGLYYYVVWSDMRNHPRVRNNTFINTPPNTINNNADSNIGGGLGNLDMDIYGARVKSSLLTGIEAIDPDGMLLHRHTSPDYFPEVAWNGTDHAVLWTSHMVENWADPSARIRRFNFYYDIRPRELQRAEVGITYTASSPLVTFTVDCLGPPNTNCTTDAFEFTILNSGTDWDTNPVTTNSLPSGMSLSTIGQITGTASAEGIYLVRIQARNITTGTDADYKEYKLIVGDPPEVLPTGCWIATAAYGSFLDPHVVILKEMRDRYLLPYTYGREIMRFYYKHSPPVAEFLKVHDTARFITRILLLPAVLFAAFLLKLSLPQQIFMIIGMLSLARILFRGKTIYAFFYPQQR